MPPSPAAALSPAPAAALAAPSSSADAAPTTAALVALGSAGLCAFLNVYATQPLLPMFARAFGVGTAAVALTVSAPGVAVAIGSPFVGALADRVGRRRTIVLSLFALAVPTLLAATSGTLRALVAWRFLQGLAVPGVYAVGVAYAAGVWEGRGVGRAMAAIVTGNVLGGFTGRTVAAAIAERGGWRWAFVVLGALTLLGASATARWLPREPPQDGRRAAGAARSGPSRSATRRVCSTPLLATFAVGFALLFTQVATFTYATFHLSAAPFRLGTTAIGGVFVVYLAGAAVTAPAGRWIERVGPRWALAGAVALGVAGVLLTLSSSLAVVITGLALTCTAVFVGQSAATTHLSRAAAPDLRSIVSGVYLSSYYVGGAAGGILPSVAWRHGGWSGCVALVAGVELAAIAVALRFWTRERELPGRTWLGRRPLAAQEASCLVSTPAPRGCRDAGSSRCR